MNPPEPIDQAIALAVIRQKRRTDRQGQSVMTALFAFCLLLVIFGMANSPIIAFGAAIPAGLFFWERRKLKNAIYDLDQAQLYFALDGTSAFFHRNETPSLLVVRPAGQEAIELRISKTRMDEARTAALPAARLNPRP
ncbi:MAG: hypothetical protein KBG15_22215 [Kofleriaceae bacterium]|nr:hypothetical protein [Kofleriaceae bacterium]